MTEGDRRGYIFLVSFFSAAATAAAGIAGKTDSVPRIGQQTGEL